MKVKIEKLQNNTFKPFTLKLDIDTLYEASVLYNLFNYTGVGSALSVGGVCSDDIRNAIASGCSKNASLDIYDVIPDFDWGQFVSLIKNG